MARFILRTREGSRTFWVRDDKPSGYVYEEFPGRSGTLGQQVCDQLYHMGETLTATPATLDAVIRREQRRRLAAERRERAREREQWGAW